MMKFVLRIVLPLLIVSAIGGTAFYFHNRNADRDVIAAAYAEMLGPEAAQTKMRALDARFRGKSAAFQQAYWPNERASATLALASARQQKHTWKDKEAVRLARQKEEARLIHLNGSLNLQQAAKITGDEYAARNNHKRSGAIAAALRKRYKSMKHVGAINDNDDVYVFGLANFKGDRVGMVTVEPCGASLTFDKPTGCAKETLARLGLPTAKIRVIDKGVQYSYHATKIRVINEGVQSSYHDYILKSSGQADSKLRHDMGKYMGKEYESVSLDWTGP